MNVSNDVSEFKPKFEYLIKNALAVYEPLAKADVVVFYCQYGANRSPAFAGMYMHAIANETDRPQHYNPNQQVMVLEGGVAGYDDTVMSTLSGQLPSFIRLTHLSYSQELLVSTRQGADHCS